MADFILPSKTTATFFIRGQINPFPKQVAEFSDEPIGTSYIGTPIYDNLIFLPINTNLASGRIDPITGLDKSALVLNDVLLSVSQPKNIVKTSISGRNGTVKEYIGLGDYEVDVRGFLIHENPNVQPIGQLDLFIEYIQWQGQLSVTSSFLQSFRINSVVIENPVISQQAGFRNRIPFTMRLVSDEDIELQLSDDVNANT